MSHSNKITQWVLHSGTEGREVLTQFNAVIRKVLGMAQWPQVDVIGKVDDHGDGSGIQGETNSQDLNEKSKGAAYDGSDGDRKWKKWVGVESGWSSDQRRRY